jgi:hypothetical protein
MNKEKIAQEINKLLVNKGDKIIYTKEEVIDLMIDSVTIGITSQKDDTRKIMNNFRDGLEKLSYQNYKKSLHNQKGCGNIKE